MPEPLIIAEAQSRVAAIRDRGYDPEEMHIMEDLLWRDVLAAIRDFSHDPDAAELASTALETEKLEFPRWYA